MSIVEIFVLKSVDGFVQHGLEEPAYRYATLCFFGGILITYAIGQVVHILSDLAFTRDDRRRGRVHQGSQQPGAVADGQVRGGAEA